MISFRPRMSGVQQPKTVNVRAWDPKSKKVVTGTAANGADDARRPACSAAKVSNDLGGGTTAVADRVAANNGEANALAKSTLDRHGATRSSRPTASRSATPRSRPAARSRSRASASSSAAPTRSRRSTHSYRGATGYQTVVPDLRPLLAARCSS